MYKDKVKTTLLPISVQVHYFNVLYRYSQTH